MPSIYEPIDTNRYEIRILHLDSAPDDGIISGRLTKVSLLTTPTYYALSYCWGDESTTKSATFNNIDVPITVNLDSALRYCRRHGIDRVWADAICINQSDLTEKSLQVRNMKQVYYHATKTIAWLGDRQDDGAEPSLKFLNLVRGGHAVLLADVSLSHSPQCRLILDGAESSSNDSANDGEIDSENGGGNDSIPLQVISDPESRTTDVANICLSCVTAGFFQGLVSLFERPYWKRRWIIQEMAVSLQVDIVCGDTTISMGSLEEAMNLCRQSRYWHARNKASSSHYATLVDLQRQYLRKSVSISDAIAATSDFLSKDPRDVIFAVVGIALDGPALVPLPSYQVSLHHLAITFTRALLREYGCFDIIWNHHQHMAERSSALPSWVPDWFAGAYPHSDFSTTGLSQFLSVPYRLQSLEGHPVVLRLQGAVLGIITATSLSLQDQPGDSFSLEGNSGADNVINYYQSRDGLREAIFECLFSRSSAVQAVSIGGVFGSVASWTKLISKTPGSAPSGDRIVWLKDYLQTPLSAHESADTDRGVDEIQRRLTRWLQVNQTFRLGGKPIGQWLGAHERFARINFAKHKWPQQLIGLLGGGGMLICYMSIYFSVPILAIFPLLCLSLCELGFMWIQELSHRAHDRYIQEVKGYMARWAWDSKRLLVTSRGMVATSSFSVRLGDRICVLAGCTGAVILRKIPGRSPQYKIVGQAYVHLSRGDYRLLERFLSGAASVASGDLDAGSARYNAAIASYQSEPWWQEFIVV